MGGPFGLFRPVMRKDAKAAGDTQIHDRHGQQGSVSGRRRNAHWTVPKGNGIYIELIWSLNERNFIKQHVLLDVQTQKVVSFSITLEAHGDAKVMSATTRGTLKMDVGLTRILADGAYDTVSNWVLTEEIDLDVAPKRLNSAILLLRVYLPVANLSH